MCRASTDTYHYKNLSWAFKKYLGLSCLLRWPTLSLWSMFPLWINLLLKNYLFTKISPITREHKDVFMEKKLYFQKIKWDELYIFIIF